MTNALFTPQTGMFRRSDLLLYPALVLILLSLYSFGLAHDLLHDELYHMLAAQGLAKTGYPQIANGLLYLRQKTNPTPFLDNTRY